MKNAVFRDIETQLVTHRKHIRYPFQIPKANAMYDLRFSWLYE
jgi:hypothetical protein